MADIVDRKTRSRMMAGIRGKDTKPELLLRSALHRRGLRFRLHGPKLPGKPDIVLTKYRTVVLVHGCFWHRHEGCKFCYAPSSNTEFWKMKFAGTVDRDQNNLAALLERGWRVATIWECALKPSLLQTTCDVLLEWLLSSDMQVMIPEVPQTQNSLRA